MLTESELEAIEKRLEGLQFSQGELLRNGIWPTDQILEDAHTDIAALLADLKLYKKAVKEFRKTWEPVFAESRSGQFIYLDHERNDPLVDTVPALATILKGVKG